MIQRGLIWALLALLLALCLHGAVTRHLFQQNVWEPAGLHRFLIFAVVYAAAAAGAIALIPRWFIPGLAGVLFLYSCLIVGPLAPIAVVYIAFASYAIGALWFRRFPEFIARSPQLTILTGFATWICVVMLTARWPVHYAVLYWLLPLISIYLVLRYQYLPPLTFEYPQARRDLVPLAIALFPLACHWLIALKPEVSSDGLAMHAVIAARMAYSHAWPFNFSEFAWAVMPMGGDWAWSIAWQLAGEAAARLLNFAVLALITWTLFERLHARVPGWISAALVGAFLATPLTQHVTGSLFVENIVAALLLGAVLLLRVHVKERRTIYYYACCFLCGVAAASKFGALAFVVPLLLAAVVQVKFRPQVIGFCIALALGCVPYLEAWIRTGNPVFPFFNGYFHSPFYAPENFRDARFETPLSFTTFYDITFHTRRFIEGFDGSAGFFFFLLLPICLVGWRKRWPRTGFVLLWVGLAGSILTLKAQSNLRYVYAALPMFTLLIGITIASIRLRSPRLGQTLGSIAFLALFLNLALLPAAGWYQRNFYADRFLQPAAAEEYLAASAPARPLISWLNHNAPTARVAWMEGNAIGDFHGTAFTNSWHSDVFFHRLHSATAPEALAWLAQDLKVDYVIAPAPDSSRQITVVHTREFVDRFTVPVQSFGGVELRRMAAAGAGEVPMPYAPPGKHDEITPYVRFAGHWTRDLQFPDAYRGTLVYSNDTRSRVQIRFHGSAVRILYTAAANRCSGLVSIDESEEAPFNEFSPQTRWQALSAPFRAAAPGDHMLRLRFPQINGKAVIGSCYLDIDGFVVE